MKEKLLRIRDLVVLNSRIIFPILLIAVVAITVSVALGTKEKEESTPDVVEAAPASESEPEETAGLTVPDVPLELNAYADVNTLIYNYYDALANGNAETIAGISNAIEDMEKIKIQELGKYIDGYPAVEVYTKPGPEENSYVVFAYTKAKFIGFDEEVAGFQTFYVCTDENGKLYLNEGETSEEYIQYIYEMNFQEDVVELYNKATVEYNEAMVANTKLFEFITTMESDIRTATGLIIAEQVANDAEEQPGETGEVPETQEGTTTDEQGENVPAEPEAAGPVYATAATTVNVRKSDSETADKVGKISTGTKVEVLEQRQNGWSKVQTQSLTGYIKSEYLKLSESAGGVQAIGKVTATTNINIRATASEDGERLGALLGGESLDLVETADGWCKVIYNGQIAYVKAEYVQQQ